MRRLLAELALVPPLMLLTASTALGVQPTSQRFHAEGTDLDVQDCGSFHVLLTFTSDVVVITYLDTSGAFTRSTIEMSFSGTVTNSITGKSAYETSHWKISVNGDGTSRIVGLVLLIRVPGAGVVLMDLGSVTLDVNGQPFLSGDPGITQGQELICEILS